MQVVRNIIFDFGGVLVGLDRGRCIESFMRIGAGNIAGYVHECRQEDLFHDLEVGHTGIGGFCDAVRRACPGCTAADTDICAAWNSLLTGIPRECLDMLSELKCSFRLVLLSNTNPIHWHKAVADYFTANGLTVEDYFEKVYLSYEMHMLKPDKDIYRRVLADAGMEAHETLFIDDSVVNCDAARKVGIGTYCSTGHGWCEWLRGNAAL